MAKAVSSQKVATLSRAPGRPSDQFKHPDKEQEPQERMRLSRTVTAKYEKQLCFFCQTCSKEDTHAIQSANRGKQLNDFVENCSSDLFKVCLSSAIQPGDALSIDIRYHTTCWTKYVVCDKTSASTDKDQCLNESELAANVEFLDLMHNKLLQGKLLSIDAAHKVYVDILLMHNCHFPCSRKYVRQVITANIPNIDFIHTVRRNECDRFCMNAATIAAIESAVEDSNVDSDMKIILKCSKIVKKAIQAASPWTFDGTLNGDLKDVIPSRLSTLLQWIMTVVVTELNEEERSTDIQKQTDIIAQQIMYQTKSDRQTLLTPKSEESGFRHTREYPLQIGTGIMIHQQTRSKSLVNYLHQLGISVSYLRILRIETQLAATVLAHSA